MHEKWDGISLKYLCHTGFGFCFLHMNKKYRVYIFTIPAVFNMIQTIVIETGFATISFYNVKQSEEVGRQASHNEMYADRAGGGGGVRR